MYLKNFQSTTRDAISGKSSSSGSYSIGGSNPNMTEDVGDKTPTDKTREQPDKIEVPKKTKEDKVTSPMNNTVPRNPKTMVRHIDLNLCFCMAYIIYIEAKNLLLLFFRDHYQMMREVVTIHHLDIMKAPLTMMTMAD